MRKIIKIGFPIACVAVIGGTFYLLNKTVKRVNENNYNNNINENNSIIQKAEDATDTFENVSKVEENIINTIPEENKKIESENEEKDKNKAIDIVKKKDVSRSNVYYTNEGKNGNKYIVAVREEDTTEVVIYYSVDLDKEEIEIY